MYESLNPQINSYVLMTSSVSAKYLIGITAKGELCVIDLKKDQFVRKLPAYEIFTKKSLIKTKIVAFEDDNFYAVNCGHLVTIYNIA